MSRLLIVTLAVLFLIPGFGFAKEDSANQDAAAPLKPLMHRKLAHAQAILEGLTLEDFELVAKNAKALKLLSLESGWNVIQAEEYESHSQHFRRTADAIGKAAAAKDIARATESYVDLTTRCIQCHSYMRSHRARPIPPETP